MADSNLLFDDLFTVGNVNQNYDRVQRIEAQSQNHDMKVLLDINSDLYPLNVADTCTLALASSLSTESADNNASAGTTDRDAWRPGQGGLADEYEYVMYGKVYKFDEGAQDTVTAYASFGGLLMALTGSYRHVANLTIGQNIYLLMRR